MEVDPYNSPNWWYDLRGFFILKFAYQSGLWSQVRFFAQHMGPKHLDVAVGTGTQLALILIFRWLTRKPSIEVDGLDLSVKMLQGAQRWFEWNRRVRLAQGDVTHLSFSDGEFDSVNVANSFHCFQEPRKALSEIARVLKIDGVLTLNVILTPKNNTLRARTSKRIVNWGIRKGLLFKSYDEAEVEKLFENSPFALMQKRLSGYSLELVYRRRV